MKKKSPSISMFVMIAVIGLLISFLNGDFAIGPIFEGLEIDSLEVLLDYVNIGLAFLALGGIFVVLIVRAARNEKELFWDFNTDDFREEE
jgi:hypothetical protein